ncbi:FAD-dependent oxidoreductase, partial [Roseomonas sp. DSM 102946]|nr:FAD-dependent oxidoreductase [Roseomonas sp. DSM 102946]
TDTLGLESIGLHPGEKGVLEVDERLRTGVDGVFAVGDIRGGPQFTHTAYDDFRVLRSLFLEDGARTTRRIVPYAIFTEPELGRVGLSEQEARKAGYPYRIGRKPMAESGKARDIGRTEGFIKVLSDPGTGKILGAAALCDSGAEVVQLFVELMNAGADLRTMLDGVHIHPTLGEAAKNAAAALDD